MCGIVGIISQNNIVENLLEGLKRVEYRGYDSAGIAVLDNNAIHRRRAVGKLVHLESHIEATPIEGCVGIGHTRWATHGPANTDNAHPHSNENVAVVHNGIIENFSQLKSELQGQGAVFQSETDTEVIVHLIGMFLKQGETEIGAVRKTLHRLEGAFALAIIFKNLNDTIIVARRGSPLVIGMGDNACFIGSDAHVLAPWTDTVMYLEERDVGILTLCNGVPNVEIQSEDGAIMDRSWRKIGLRPDAVSKGHYPHYMLKEIHEQPTVIADTLESLMNIGTKDFKNATQNMDWPNINHIQIVACGTSYYAGLVAKYWFERYANIMVSVDIASEFRYRHPVIDAIDLGVCISQSGETIDTLSAIKMIKDGGRPTMGILNVDESSIGRLVDTTLKTEAGPEIGVASTKAFTSQLMVFATLALQASQARGVINNGDFDDILDQFIKLPGQIVDTLTHDMTVSRLCESLVRVKDVLYLGRGLSYPVAMEGALKLKELSYIHAEGYPAGELKHGPIALIDPGYPVVVVAPHDEWFEKTISNMQEVVARGARVMALTDRVGAQKIENLKLRNVEILTIDHPTTPWTSPILYTILIQLMAYYTASHKGTDVDQPRNLAKSVTVE